MDRQLLDTWCERGIHLLVLGILIFGPLAIGAVRTSGFLVIEILTLGVIALWLARFWLDCRHRLLWPPICWAVLAFVIYAVIRCQLVEIEYVARYELNRIIIYAVLFLAILNNLNRRESAQLVSFTLIGLATALALFALYQFGTHYGKIWNFHKPPGYLTRGSGTYFNPNHLAGFLEMILPLALAYTLLGRLGITVRVILGYSALVIMVGIGVSLSRGGMLATGAMLVFFFLALLFQRDFWLRAILLFGVVLVLVVGFYANTSEPQSRFDQIFSSGKADDDRFNYWNSAQQIWKNHFWVGAGPGHFDQEFWAYRPPQVQTRPQYVHNDYLNTLCDWGVIGLGLIVATAALFYAGIFKTWPFMQRNPNEIGSKQSNKAAFVLGGSFGFLAILFHSFLDFNMQIPANAILAITLLALVSAHRRFATEKFWFDPGLMGKIAMTTIALLALGFLAVEAQRNAGENAALQRANAQPALSDSRLAELKKAFAIEPANFETAYTLGEFYRLKSWQGGRDHEAAARSAIDWFKRAMKLNPYFPYSPLRLGMCLDWIGQTGPATAYFERAHRLDPNGYFVATYEGWHWMQLEKYAEAKKQFERSLTLHYNELAADYLELVNDRLAAAPDLSQKK